MKLQHKVMLFGMCSVLPAILLGLSGLRMIGNAMQDSSVADNMLQASQQADMMHDAIRGDAQLALLGALQGDASSIQQAQSDVREHAQSFLKEMDGLSKLGDNPQIDAAVAAIRPNIETYISEAEAIIQASGQDKAQALGRTARFQQSFKVLEDQMGNLSGLIDKEVERLGQHATDVAGLTRTLMLGGGAAAVVVMLIGGVWLSRQVTRALDKAAQSARMLSQGQLHVPVASEGIAETKPLLEAMSLMQINLRDMIMRVREIAEGLAAVSAQIAGGTQELHARTSQQNEALSRTACAIEQLSGTVQLNTDHASQANQLAQGASGVAEQGGSVVGQVVETMRDINHSSSKIADIISVIDGIAFQTNILALNAAVEAARAGEQGRGFAVVAGEVRSLAQRSAEAAKEINALISASVGRVEVGTRLVDQAGSTMQEIVQSIKRVTDIMGEISAASADQSVGIDQVGQSVKQMDQATQSNASLVDQNAAAAGNLRDQAQMLLQAVGQFKLR